MLKDGFIKLKEKYDSASIQTKYLFTTIILLVAIFLSGMFVSINMYRTLYNNEISAARADFNNSYDNITLFEKRMLHIVNLCQANKETAALLKEMPSTSANQYQQRQQDISATLYSLADGSDDYLCRLYVDSPFVLSYDKNARIQSLNTISNKLWAQNILLGWGHWRFLSAQTLETDSPALLAPLRDQDDYNKISAIMQIDLNTDYYSKETSNPRSDYFAYTIIQTTDDDFIASSSREVTDAISQDNFDSDSLTGFKSFDLSYTRQGGNSYFYRCLPYSGWRLVMVIDNSILRAQLLRSTVFQFLIGFFVAVIGLLCAVPILYQTSSRIKRFYNYVCSSNESLSAIPKHLSPINNDEIGKLIVAHNDLMDNIHSLMVENEKREKELHRLELNVLQAQIKPHFLYNTLEAISWMTKMNQGDKVDATVKNLTRFYRLCLSNGRDVLKLSEELEMVDKYFSIQEIKYSQNLSLSFDVPDDISIEKELPKLTLQPLVENALVHGILESGKKDGWVKIIGRKALDESSADYEICIMDSGNHFSKKDFDACIHKKVSSSEAGQGLGEGYGLSNVEQRLCLFFKKDSVMYLDESVTDCTCIVIPL